MRIVFVEFGGVAEFVDPQLNNSLQELNLGGNDLTDEFTADDNFIHLSKLGSLNLSYESFSEAGIAAISLLLQVQFPFDLFVCSLCSFTCPHSLSNSFELVCFPCEVNLLVLL